MTGGKRAGKSGNFGVHITAMDIFIREERQQTKDYAQEKETAAKVINEIKQVLKKYNASLTTDYNEPIIVEVCDYEEKTNLRDKGSIDNENS